ncbi:uncharacterized protein LOC123293919 isoform X2 [Chrysoperla carnea]|uniref:uncharacterized protein LOC123293919 isoform X2 n=1 Tax=Chrysoperla carnea TaxID=189513 RepID=UPI001D088E20|nr:uncharacterized protein LOC123293919 isoform X2 [Chrysoperla carnea]
MLDGWYCRSMASANIDEESAEDEESQDEEVINYKEQYRQLKRKLKYLIYENESFQEALRSAQRRLIIATQDRSFLLDRLLLYERVENSSSESEETDSSDDPEMGRADFKRKRIDTANTFHSANNQPMSVSKASSSSAKKKKSILPKVVKQSLPQPVPTQDTTLASSTSDGHMTPEEVERHLQSRQTIMELLPERAPPTVPTEMFSNDPSLDSESNDVGELETSPSNIGEDVSVDMMAE